MKPNNYKVYKAEILAFQGKFESNNHFVLYIVKLSLSLNLLIFLYLWEIEIELTL